MQAREAAGTRTECDCFSYVTLTTRMASQGVGEFYCCLFSYLEQDCMKEMRTV